MEWRIEQDAAFTRGDDCLVLLGHSKTGNRALVEDAVASQNRYRHTQHDLALFHNAAEYQPRRMGPLCVDRCGEAASSAFQLASGGLMRLASLGAAFAHHSFEIAV